jgi:hypothetical protein
VVGSLIALMIAPALVALATLVARRWGARAGGVVSAFPAIVGPVLLILALGHGRVFAARAADGTLLGLVSLAAFALAYGRVASARGWRASLLAGWAAAALAAPAAGLAGGGAGSPVGLLVAAGSLLIAHWGLWAGASTAVGVAPAPRDGSIPVRMASAALLVAGLSVVSGLLGALVGGMLAALPVLACVLAVFTHREEGAAGAVALLRGMLAGMGSFVLFCQVIAVAVAPYGIAPAFAAATAVALALQAIAVYPPAWVQSLLRRHSSAARPVVAAAAGSLRRQSS